MSLLTSASNHSANSMIINPSNVPDGRRSSLGDIPAICSFDSSSCMDLDDDIDFHDSMPLAHRQQQRRMSRCRYSRRRSSLGSTCETTTTLQDTLLANQTSSFHSNSTDKFDWDQLDNTTHHSSAASIKDSFGDIDSVGISHPSARNASNNHNAVFETMHNCQAKNNISNNMVVEMNNRAVSYVENNGDYVKASTMFEQAFMLEEQEASSSSLSLDGGNDDYQVPSQFMRRKLMQKSSLNEHENNETTSVSSASTTTTTEQMMGQQMSPQEQNQQQQVTEFDEGFRFFQKMIHVDGGTSSLSSQPRFYHYQHHHHEQTASILLYNIGQVHRIYNGNMTLALHYYQKAYDAFPTSQNKIIVQILHNIGTMYYKLFADCEACAATSSPTDDEQMKQQQQNVLLQRSIDCFKTSLQYSKMTHDVDEGNAMVIALTLNCLGVLLYQQPEDVDETDEVNNNGEDQVKQEQESQQNQLLSSVSTSSSKVEDAAPTTTSNGNDSSCTKELQSLSYFRQAYDIMINTNVYHIDAYTNLFDDSATTTSSSTATTCRTNSLTPTSLQCKNQILGTIHNNIGRVYFRLNSYDDSLYHYNKSLNMRLLLCTSVSLSSSYVQLDYAATLFNVGQTLHKKSDFVNALPYYEKFLNILRGGSSPVNNNQQHIAVVLSAMADLYQCQGKYAEALELCFNALEICQDIYGDYHTEIASLLHRIGHIYFDSQNIPMALKYCYEGLRLDMTLLSSKPHQHDHQQQGKTIFKKVHDDEEEVITHPKIIVTLCNIGEIHRQCGEYDKAIQMYKDALKRQRIQYSTTTAKNGSSKNVINKSVIHDDIAQTLNTLGLIYDQNNDHVKSVKYLKKCIAMRKELLDQINDDKCQSKKTKRKELRLSIASTLMYVGKLYYKNGNVVNALSVYKEAYVIRKDIHDSDASESATMNGNASSSSHDEDDNSLTGNFTYADVALALYNVGLCHLSQSRYDDAILCLLETLRIEKIVYGYHESTDESTTNTNNKKTNSKLRNVGVTLYKLGQAYNGNGDLDRALYYFNEALRIERLVCSPPEVYGDSTTSGGDPATLSRILNDIGNVHRERNEISLMMNAFNESTRLLEQIQSSATASASSRNSNSPNNISSDNTMMMSIQMISVHQQHQQQQNYNETISNTVIIPTAAAAA